MELDKMSKAELLAHVRELEAKVDAQGETGRVWPDVSKAVRDGKEKQSSIVFRGVNAKPQNTVNLYPSQLARFLKHLPESLDRILSPELWPKFACRSDEERKATKAYLTAYLADLRGEDK